MAHNKEEQLNTILQAYFVGLHLVFMLDAVKETQFYKHELKQSINKTSDLLVQVWDKSFNELYKVGEDEFLAQLNYTEELYKSLIGLELDDYWRVCGVVKLATENKPKFNSVCAAMGIQVIDKSLNKITDDKK